MPAVAPTISQARHEGVCIWELNSGIEGLAQGVAATSQISARLTVADGIQHYALQQVYAGVQLCGLASYG